MRQLLKLYLEQSDMYVIWQVMASKLWKSEEGELRFNLIGCDDAII